MGRVMQTFQLTANQNKDIPLKFQVCSYIQIRDSKIMPGIEPVRVVFHCMLLMSPVHYLVLPNLKASGGWRPCGDYS